MQEKTHQHHGKLLVEETSLGVFPQEDKSAAGRPLHKGYRAVEVIARRHCAIVCQSLLGPVASPLFSRPGRKNIHTALSAQGSMYTTPLSMILRNKQRCSVNIVLEDASVLDTVRHVSDAFRA